MTAQNPTPGPWLITKPDRFGRVYVAGTIAELAEVMYTGGPVKTPLPWAANARLMAAAPELLGALKEALEEIENSGDPAREKVEALCRAAVAKAEGRKV